MTTATAPFVVHRRSGRGRASYQRLAGAAGRVAATRRPSHELLVCVLLCVLPASGLMAAGQIQLASICFWVLLGLMLLRLALLGKRDALLSLVISLSPLTNLLRDFALYNIVVALMGMSLLYYYWRSPATLVGVLSRCRLALGLFAYVGIYYALGVLLTGDYSANIRMLEGAFVVMGVLVLARQRPLLNACLQGFLICACAVGIAMSPYVGSTDRLGMLVVEGYSLGNPSQLGGTLSLVLLASALDWGRWLHLEKRRVVLFGSVAVTIALLYMTASRVSWLVVTAGSLVALLVGRGQRFRLLVVTAMLAVTLPTLLLTRYGAGVQKGLDRTFGQDRSVRSRTSGRSDQWPVAYFALTESAGSLLYGHGPGMSPGVYARASLAVPDIEYAVGDAAPFHSLYMQVAVEAGVLGLALLAGWFAVIVSKAFRWIRMHGEVLPLAAIVAYLCIAGTESAQGTTSGVFLGLGLLASSRQSNVRWLRSGRSAGVSGRWNQVPVAGTA